MTTPILNILEINAQPPYGVGLLELDRLQRDLTAIYERLTKDDREVLLEKDFRALLSAHVSAKVDIRALEQKRLAMLHPGRNVEDLKIIQYGIERIASHLLRIADGLNARLSKSLIERFSNYHGESETKFYEIIKWAYIATPAPKAAQVDASQAMPSATQTPTAAGQADEAGQEPEAATPKPLPTDLPSGDLPPVLDTPKARRVFGKAIEKGYMKKLLSGGFEWNGVTETGRNVQLAYLCGKIYGYHYTQKGNTGTQFPESELSDTFALENLQTSLFNFYDRPAKRRQKWIDKLDELLD